jgi:hypothetical protein
MVGAHAYTLFIDNVMNALTLTEDTGGKISLCKFAKDSVSRLEDCSNAV